jgi:Mce-associated membrane protein
MLKIVRRIRWRRGPFWLSAAIVLLAATGTALTATSFVLRDSPAATNRALTDGAATRQVAAAVSGDLEQIFSYNYTDLQSTRLAAQRVLAGSAAHEYSELFPELHNAVGQQLSVTTTVTHAGVTELSGESAQILVFMNQTATRGASTVGGTPYHAQLAITAELRGGRWRIVDIVSR